MKDRVPTQVVDGAVRMEQLDADGNSLGYIYLRRADEPSEPGTPYSKNSVLTDETASALGLDVASNPTPNDAFEKVAGRIKGIEALKKSVMFPVVWYTSSSATFTASKAGTYRITVVGKGGSGGNSDNLITNGIRYTSTGGGGGSGAICVAELVMAANATIHITIDDNGAMLDGIMVAKNGSNGSDGTRSGNPPTSYIGHPGSGGVGGVGIALSEAYPIYIYNGNSGEDGQSYTRSSVYGYPGARGGDAPSLFAGQMIRDSGDSFQYDGSGIFSFNELYTSGGIQYVMFKFGNLGYGKCSGWIDDNKNSISPSPGGSAGAVVEYMGA